MKKLFLASATIMAAYCLGKLLADILSPENLGEIEVEYGGKKHKYSF